MRPDFAQFALGHRIEPPYEIASRSVEVGTRMTLQEIIVGSRGGVIIEASGKPVIHLGNMEQNLVGCTLSWVRTNFQCQFFPATPVNPVDNIILDKVEPL